MAGHTIYTGLQVPPPRPPTLPNDPSRVLSTACARPQHPARCVEAVVADPDRSRFVVGTCSLLGDNELQIVEYNPAAEEVVSCGQIFTHSAGEVWCVSWNLLSRPSRAPDPTASGTSLS